MQFRTPLANARGHGSAKAGTHHFWLQRLTAIALVPLTLWFAVQVIRMSTADYALAAAWVQSPWVTVMLIGLVVALFLHAQLGLQVVIEDYVSAEGLRLGLIIVLKLACALLGGACVLAILRVAL